MSETKYVVFQLGAERYGLPIDSVERILPSQSVTKLPKTPKMMLGVFDMRGETISGYMRQHYAPERLVLAAAGQVEHERLVELASQAFTDLSTGTANTPEPARYAGGEIRTERDLEQVHIVLGLPGVSYRDPDHYALGILSTLFGGGMSSRLFQEIREKRGLVYSIYSFASAFHDGGVFGVYAGTGEKEAE